jgi:rhamnosyltransferase
MGLQSCSGDSRVRDQRSTGRISRHKMGSLEQFGPASRHERPVASIVMRAKNEEALLGETLARLHSQTFRDAEIVLVDSGSTDRTLDIARSFSGVRVIKIRPEDFTFGHALNVGCERSRGDFLVFLSAHAPPATDHWLARLLGHFADERVVGVWGGQRPRKSANPPRRILRQDLSMFLSNVYFGFNNANSAVRKSVWEKYPFNEGLAGSEDKEWAYRVLSDGHVLIHDREAFVYHDHEESLGQIWWRAHREHLGFADFLPEHRVGFGDMFRYAYPRLRSAWKRTRGKAGGASGFAAAAASILASTVGQYTGSRKWLAGPRAEFHPRVHATQRTIIQNYRDRG